MIERMRKFKSNLLAASALTLLAALSAASFAQESNPGALESQLSELNAVIKQKGAKWVAGETPLSRLSLEDLLRRVGTSMLKIHAQPVPETGALAAPSKLDWRSNNGNFVSPVKDQKKCGSCWAFAMTAGLESNVLLKRSALGGDVDLSEQVLVSCSGIGSCNGGTLDADYLQKTGLPPERYYPYTATDGDCASAQDGWEKEASKIGSWGSVPQKLASIKSALAKYGPLPTAFYVYEDFKNYKSGVYSYVSGKKLGGHAVLLVGYNDDEQYFIVKNSWSGKWGEDGYFKIAYSEMDNKVNFGLMTIAYKSAGFAEDAVRFSSDETSRRIGPLMEQAR